jgi:deazaflavin-dependent oxidoreductase (nitroreductase family)
VEDDLVRDGRVLRIETTGRRTGRSVTAVVGFVERGDGSLVVAAGPGADWAENLLTEPAALVTLAGRTFAVHASTLDGPARAAVVRELILRYGTPAERLGSGPAFELRPLDVPGSDESRSSR